MSFLQTDKDKNKKQKQEELNKMRKERRNLNFGEIKFSIDIPSIPFICSVDYDYLVDGTKCYQVEKLGQIKDINNFIQESSNPDYDHVIFFRRRMLFEEKFKKDYDKLIKYKTIKGIRNFKPNTSNQFTINIFNKLKESLINDIIISKEDLKPDKEPNKILHFTLDNKGYPYRSYTKLKSLYDDFDRTKYKKNIQHYNNYNIKENKKKYNLKTYSTVKNSFIGDIFFESNKAAFLLLININTRFAYAYQLGDIETKEIINIDENNKEYEMKYATQGRKTTKELLKAFDKFLNKHPVNILRFDGEKAIGSEDFKSYLKSKGIKFIPAITEAHTSLSLIDRLCRTLRDIAFNLNYEGIYHQDIMNIILNYYNNSRHETLTQTLFKAYPDLKHIYPFISPAIMENNTNNLENLFVKECIKYNFFIKSQPDYNINDEDVKVVNNHDKLTKKRAILSKDDYTITNQIGNIFELKNKRTNKKTYKPRYFIKPIKRRELSILEELF